MSHNIKIKAKKETDIPFLTSDLNRILVIYQSIFSLITRIYWKTKKHYTVCKLKLHYVIFLSYRICHLFMLCFEHFKPRIAPIGFQLKYIIQLKHRMWVSKHHSSAIANVIPPLCHSTIRRYIFSPFQIETPCHLTSL